MEIDLDSIQVNETETAVASHGNLVLQAVFLVFSSDGWPFLFKISKSARWRQPTRHVIEKQIFLDFSSAQASARVDCKQRL